jgi:hypothetical protein
MIIEINYIKEKNLKISIIKIEWKICKNLFYIKSNIYLLC